MSYFLIITNKKGANAASYFWKLSKVVIGRHSGSRAMMVDRPWWWKKERINRSYQREGSSCVGVSVSICMYDYFNLFNFQYFFWKFQFWVNHLPSEIIKYRHMETVCVCVGVCVWERESMRVHICGRDKQTNTNVGSTKRKTYNCTRQSQLCFAPGVWKQPIL